MSRPPRIKTIIPASPAYYAAFAADHKKEIGRRVVRVLCWSLIEDPKPDIPDEVIGQIIVGDTITEVTNVDEEEGFGEFLGYFESDMAASQAIITHESLEDDGGYYDDDNDDEDEDDEDEEV